MLVKIEALEAVAKAWFSLPTAPIISDNQSSIDNSWKTYREITEDVGTIVQKIQSDCSYVSNLSDSLKNIQNSMRIIQLHDREFLSKAQDLTKELWNIHKSWALSKTFNTKKSVALLRTVSQIQFFSSPLRQQIATLAATVKSAEADRMVVARAIDMPYLYGALLFELIRRDEWMEHIKARVNRTAEMMAGWREDEIKRRTKWIRQLGGSLGMLKRIGGGGGSSGPGGASDVPDVEITLINSTEYKSYALERKDMDQYLQLLKSHGLEEEYEELAALVTKTDKINPFPEPVPVEHQKMQQQLLRRKSVFKEGNMSEYSKSLLLSRSMGLDPPINKVEELPPKGDSSVDLKIQVYEARIRKLEDMLHRNQFRDSWTNKFHAPGVVDSTSMIKVSATDEQHQALLDKIKLLEEQAQEKDQEVARLNAENGRLSAEIEQKNFGLEEAQVMKLDLMANLSTKESEFNTERRSFQKEIADLKHKLYELEVEFDREIELSLALEEEVQSYKHQNSLQIARFRKALKTQKRSSIFSERKYLKVQTRYDILTTRARDLSQRLYTSTIRNSELLESLGMQIRKEIDEEDNCVLSFKIQRVKGLGRRTRSALSANNNNNSESIEGEKQKIDPTVLYWVDPSPNDPKEDEDEEDEDNDDDDDENKDEDTSDEDNLYINDEDSENMGVRQSATTTQKIIDSGSLISAQSMGNSIVSLQNTELLPQKLDSGLSKVEKTKSIDSANTDKDSIESPTKHSSLYSSTYEQRRQLKRQERQKKLQEQQKQSPKLIEGHQTRQKSETREKKREADMQLRLEKYRRRATKQSELRYQRFLNSVYIDYDLFRVSVTKRFSDVEHLARKLQKECRGYRENAHIQELASRGKLAYRSFKQGDLALFLPTRDQTRDPNPWAAFNVGAPHYFLKPLPEHRLFERDWLVARITKIEERVVDRIHGEEKDNPFDLSDGLKWHLLEAVEEK